MIFEWEKDADNLYTRVRVTKSEYEDCFGRYGKKQRRYDSFYNEWDMCKDFGSRGPDERVITESDDEDNILGPLPTAHQTPTHLPEPSAKNSAMDVSQPDLEPPILPQPVGIQGASV